MDRLATLQDCSLRIDGENIDFTDIRRYPPDAETGDVKLVIRIDGDALGELATVSHPDIEIETPTATISPDVERAWPSWEFDGGRMKTFLHAETNDLGLEAKPDLGQPPVDVGETAD